MEEIKPIGSPSQKTKLLKLSIPFVGIAVLLGGAVFTANNAIQQQQNTQSKAAITVSLVKAINFNGPQIVVDGVTFQAESTAGVTYANGALRFSNTTQVLNPAVSASKTQMIRSSVWNVNDLKLNVPVSNGSYQVYVYNWEDNDAQTFGLLFEGVSVGNFSSGLRGSWRKLGPYNVNVSDGNVSLHQTGGDFNLSGMEIYKVTTTAPTPTIPPTRVPTLAPTATRVPTAIPTAVPTPGLTLVPTATTAPTQIPTPTTVPTVVPTAALTLVPTAVPTQTPTIAPTAIVPTNTPVPTATPVPGGTTIQATLLLHGLGRGGDSVNASSLGNFTLQRPQRTITMEIFDVQNQLVLTKQGTVTFDTTAGNFVGTIDLGTQFATGLYTVKIKTDQFLRGLVGGIQTVTVGQKTTLASLTLVGGDVNNDNQINIVDYNIIVGCYSDLLPPISCTTTDKVRADINDDGNVNQFDYNLFIRELTNVGGQ